MIPSGTWELHVEERIPEGLVFRLQLVTLDFEKDFKDIIWPESMAFECELSVCKEEEGKKSPSCIFRELKVSY
jgi:hypothetical protein